MLWFNFSFSGWSENGYDWKIYVDRKKVFFCSNCIKLGF